ANAHLELEAAAPVPSVRVPDDRAERVVGLVEIGLGSRESDAVVSRPVEGGDDADRRVGLVAAAQREIEVLGEAPAGPEDELAKRGPSFEREALANPALPEKMQRVGQDHFALGDELI